MNTIQVLIGSAERRLNCLIEATALDLYYNRAALNFTRTDRLGEFERQGTCASFDALVLAPNHLLPESGQRELNQEGLVQAVWNIKNLCSVPVVVIGTPAELEYRIVEAGADAVLPEPLNRAEFKQHLARLLVPAEAEEPTVRRRWSLSGFFSFLG